MLKNLLMVVLAAVCVCAIAMPGTADAPAAERGETKPLEAAQMLKEDRTALELGRKVLAVREAIQNPKSPNAIKAVTDLGHDQRHYVMVRGWLSYQLQGDTSILKAAKERTRDEVKDRIGFLKKAIRAIDLE